MPAYPMAALRWGRQAQEQQHIASCTFHADAAATSATMAHGCLIRREFLSENLLAELQTLDRNVKVTATNGDEKKISAEGVVRQRFYTAQEVALLGKATGMSVVAQFGALKLPFMEPCDEEGYSLVTVLQKQ